MDLLSERSAVESVQDNEAVGTNENFDNLGDSAHRVENNGSFPDWHDKQLSGDVNGKIVEVKMELPNSPSTVSGKALDSPSPGTVTKGYGLRKWRRIKRDVTKAGVRIEDSSKLLKRGLSNLVMQSGKPVQFSADRKQMSEGSVSSTNAIERGPGDVVDGFAMVSDLRLGMGLVFASGTDSENSEDQSSKSSTAASVPEMRHEGFMAVGKMRDKYKTKSLSVKNLGSFVPQVQHVKVQTETTKKARGERVKIEKENSHSSMESDLRSSNFVFMQGSDSVNSNGRQNGRSPSYDGNNSDDGHGIDQQVNEELRAFYLSKNGDLKDVPQGSAGLSLRGKEETRENQGFSTDQDPLVGPIQLLQSVQEALEREVQKFREIGTEDILVDDSSLESCLPTELISASLEVRDPRSSEPLHPGDHVPQSMHISESEILTLKENIHILESKLDDVTASFEIKEAKVVELESVLNNRWPKGVTGTATESELEALFRQKIEAEVEYLSISRTIHNLKTVSVDQTTLLEEQRRLASEQSKILNKLGDAESKSVKLRIEADTLNQQKRVHKYISCFIIQLVLLVVFIKLFILQLSPHSAGVVPT